MNATLFSNRVEFTELGNAITLAGSDILRGEIVKVPAPNVPGNAVTFVRLFLCGDAKEAYGNYYDVDFRNLANQPTWTDRVDTVGAFTCLTDLTPIFRRPISTGGGGGQVDTVTGGTATFIDATDPVNLISNVLVDGVTIGVNGLNQLEVPAGGGGYVPTTRLINTTAPLAGGGDLSTDRTLTHQNSGVVAAAYTNASVTINATGHVTAASSGAAPVTSVGATSPILSSGGATPTISASTSNGGNNAADAGKLLIFDADGAADFSNNGSGGPALGITATGTGDGVYATATAGDALHGVSTAGKAVHAIATGTAPAAHANGQGVGIALEAEQNGGGGADIALFHDGSGNGLEVKTDGGLEWTSATGAQTTADNLPVFGALTKGVVPAAGAVPAATNFLDETGAWSAPAAPTGAALTRTDDTNVTLTLGGSPSTALLAAASITAGWTGQLSIARGGTNAATEAAALTNLGILRTSLTSAFVTNSASFVDVTGMALTVPAGKTAKFTFYVPYSSATTSVGIGLSMTVTGSPLLRHFTRFTPINSTGTPVRAMITTDDGGAVNASTVTANAKYGIEMNGVVVADASPCVVQLRMAVGGTPANITLAAGSVMMATLID